MDRCCSTELADVMRKGLLDLKDVVEIPKAPTLNTERSFMEQFISEFAEPHTPDHIIHVYDTSHRCVLSFVAPGGITLERYLFAVFGESLQRLVIGFGTMSITIRCEVLTQGNNMIQSWIFERVDAQHVTLLKTQELDSKCSQ